MLRSLPSLLLAASTLALTFDARAALRSAPASARANPARAPGACLMAKKPKVDKRSWLPKRSSPFAREVDVALQLVSRAAAGVGKAPAAAVNLATQALVCDGLASEFEGDTVMAAESAESFAGCDAETRQAALALANELGATTPCVNAFVPPYPDPVARLETAEAPEMPSTDPWFLT